MFSVLQKTFRLWPLQPHVSVSTTTITENTNATKTSKASLQGNTNCYFRWDPFHQIMFKIINHPLASALSLSHALFHRGWEMIRFILRSSPLLDPYCLISLVTLTYPSSPNGKCIHGSLLRSFLVQLRNIQLTLYIWLYTWQIRFGQDRPEEYTAVLIIISVSSVGRISIDTILWIVSASH